MNMKASTNASMTMTTTSNRRNSAGAKSLLAAFTMAATLGGWAGLTLGETKRQSELPPPTREPFRVHLAEDQAIETAVLIELPPLPTVVPLVVPASAELLKIESPAHVAVVSAPSAAPMPLRIVIPPAAPPPSAVERDEPAGRPEPAASTRSSR